MGFETTRRDFIRNTGWGIASAAAVSGLDIHGPLLRAEPIEVPSVAPTSRIRLTVNQRPYALGVEDRWTLAEVLRDHLGLTGTKVACDRGECGACTVLLEGRAVYACSYLAVWADGKEVLTVEGLAQGEQLDPLQEAFIEHDGPQCGFCTSGQLMAARALLNQVPEPTPPQVREGLAGNLCRCSNYNRYVEAVLAAAGKEGRHGK
ncbi:MAG: (2Fe-2S)-binding protein [Acidobacteria bacterium]|nr:(2Fe-2S)-binding protein [Acidobacteriota bacterium]